MLFNSYIFILFFFPITLLGYFTLNKYAYGKKGMAGILWLFLMSLWFYGYEKPIYLVLILSSIAVNYLVSKLIYWMKKHNKPHQRTIMWLGVFANLAVLFYFKYMNFFFDSIKGIYDFHWHKEIALPLGISFFTFQQVSYIADCYRSKEGINYNFFEYAAYVTFFPQLVAGPIVMHSELVPQLQDRSKKTINYENMSRGLYAFALGLSKKVLLADSLSRVVTAGFADISSLNSMTAVLVMIAYTLQIYFDFSGYSDMAIGMGLMFNVELPVNFDSPYKAYSIGDFWTRWHKTLNRFFIQYVYIPLGGSRKGKLRTYLNTVIIFLLSGIWHGANWTYIMWGVTHGILLVIEKGFGELNLGVKNVTERTKKFIHAFRVAVTFIIVNPTMVLFRSESIPKAWEYMERIFSGGSEVAKPLTDIVNDMIEIRILGRIGLNGFIEQYPAIPFIVVLVILLIGVFFLRNTQEKVKQEAYDWKRTIVTVGLMVWCMVSLSDVSEFLYFNF